MNLLSRSVTLLFSTQMSLNVCYVYHITNHLVFSLLVDLIQFLCIGGYAIEYVKEWPHLGYIVVSSCSDARDIRSRRFSLILNFITDYEHHIRSTFSE